MFAITPQMMSNFLSSISKFIILLSIIFAKTEGESNFGKQHQSIEEFSLINAEDLQFPIIP